MTDEVAATFDADPGAGELRPPHRFEVEHLHDGLESGRLSLDRLVA